MKTFADTKLFQTNSKSALADVANDDILYVPLGESLTLSCSHEDKDVENPVWTFNNKVLYADSFKPNDIGFANVNVYSNNSYNSYLYIEEIRVKNAGEYICFIDGTIRREIYVNVTDANNNTRWVLVGESITLSCSNKDDDEQPAVWIFNDEVLNANLISPTDKGFGNVKGYSSNSSLYIERIQVKNAGEYKCLIDGTIRRKIYVNVTDIRFNNAGRYECIIKGAIRTEVHINVAAIPQLTIQANHEVIDEVHLVESEEQVELECMALNSTLNISLFWTIETNTSLYFMQQETRAVQTQETLVDYHTELNFIAEEDTNITCSIKHDLLQNYTCNETISVVITPNRANLNVVTPTRNIFYDMNYVFVCSGVAVTVLVCIVTIILCVVPCKKKEKNSGREVYSRQSW